MSKPDSEISSGTESPQAEAELPSEGRLGGVDFGTKRVGIATCDPSQNWVTPYETYTRQSDDLDLKYFSQVARDEALVGWVIGLPIHCDGEESQKSQEARLFGVWLSKATGLPHVFYDERFTTAEARRLLNASSMSGRKKKQNLDRIAAHLILSHYLNSSKQPSGGARGLD